MKLSCGISGKAPCPVGLFWLQSNAEHAELRPEAASELQGLRRFSGLLRAHSAPGRRGRPHGRRLRGAAGAWLRAGSRRRVLAQPRPRALDRLRGHRAAPKAGTWALTSRRLQDSALLSGGPAGARPGAPETTRAGSRGDANRSPADPGGRMGSWSRTEVRAPVRGLHPR